MRVGICSVGTELVVGDVADTNAAWLAGRLVEVGAAVPFHVAVGDDRAEIAAALRWLVDRCDAVVVGGGLGPTPDDLTRDAIAEVAGVALERRDELVEQVAAVFRRGGYDMPASNLRQADLPVGAAAFDAVGTAPGFSVDVDGVTVFALPGVPFELRTMAERDVLPEVLRRSGGHATVTRSVRVAGRGESAVAAALDDVTDRYADAGAVRVAFLAGPDGVAVKVTADGASPADARARVDPVVEEVVARLGAAVAGVDEERLEDAVARLLRSTGLTVATAESCTAGAVASRLASVPGASAYLRGAVVAYATDVKTSVLGVPVEVVDAHGPVATATAEAMAERARALFGADLAVAVTCVAGPDPQGGRPVGVVCVGLANVDGTVRSRELRFVGDRDTVRARAASAALDALRRALLRVTA